MSYQVFKRKAWHKVGGRWVPFASPGRAVRRVATIEEARKMCEEHNKGRPPHGTAGYFNWTYYEFRRVGQ